MSALFNYNTIDVELIKKTRTLQISLNNKNSLNSINLELLFELESILAWSTSRVEIHSILINSTSSKLSQGIDQIALKHMNEKQLHKITSKLQKITHALFHLPQTVIVDLGKGASNLGAELAIGADIRISDINTTIVFDHTNYGLIPCSGGIGILSTVVGNTFARNWILTARAIPINQLIQSGFIYDTYSNMDHDVKVSTLLADIHRQSPVQRIQSKLGLFEDVKHDVEQATIFETQIAKAARITRDWKEEPKDAMQAKSMSKAVKLSLVKKESPIN